MDAMAAADPPPKRTLDRPPSDRYRRFGPGSTGGEIAPEDAVADAEGDERRAAPELRAAVVAIIGAAIMILIGGVLPFTTGQLFVAGVTGALVGLFLAGSERPRSWVRRAAVVIALAVVIVGAMGAWLIGLAEGGNMDPFTFLWATTGVLVPVELVIAALAAAWGAGAGPIRP